MTTRPPDPDGDTIAGDPRLIDVESISEQSDDTFDVGDSAAPSGSSSSHRFRSWFDRPGDGLVGGVCAELGAALGIDALWVRVAFVVLGIVGGVGVVVYVGLWLTLIVGAERSRARLVGGAVIIGFVPFYLSSVQPTMATGTGGVLLLLVGLTYALWNRTTASTTVTGDARVPSVTPPPRASDRIADQAPAPRSAAPTVDDPLAAPVGPSPRSVRVREPRVRPPASPLGRATLGAAIVVAAVGALIDERNGGRLHPEQWLGAAAVVCGLGLLVGAVRGRGRWLVLPAAAFAGAGFVGGAMAQAGVSFQNASDPSIYIGGGNGYVAGEYEVGAVLGSVWIDVQPDFVSEKGDEPVEIDARAVFGDVEMSVDDDVTVLVRTDIDNGTATVDGRQVGTAFTVGSGGEPDVIVDARVVHGDVRVNTYDASEQFAEELPTIDGGFDVGDGVSLSNDGNIVLLGGEVIIGPDNTPISGMSSERIGGGYVLDTSIGAWTLEGNLLYTPDAAEIDLDQIRVDDGVAFVEDPMATTTLAPTVPVSTNSQEG